MSRRRRRPVGLGGGKTGTRREMRGAVGGWPWTLRDGMAVLHDRFATLGGRINEIAANLVSMHWRGKRRSQRTQQQSRHLIGSKARGNSRGSPTRHARQTGFFRRLARRAAMHWCCTRLVWGAGGHTERERESQTRIVSLSRRPGESERKATRFDLRRGAAHASPL
ncbi:hypothetical protein L1887_59194 [Cichorium endivia]|nr:hypothetical protein L1887_59194 [Cichorium endivia]